jgi:hypothetical protein
MCLTSIRVSASAFQLSAIPFRATMAAYATAQGIHSGLLDTLAKGLAAPANSSERQAAHGTLQIVFLPL